MKAFSAVLLLLAGSISAESVYEKIWDASESDLELAASGVTVKTRHARASTLGEFIEEDEDESEDPADDPPKSKSKKEDKKSKKKSTKKDDKKTSKSKKEDKKSKKKKNDSPSPSSSKSKKKRNNSSPSSSTTTSSKSSRTRSGKCVDDDKPQVTRNGDRYRFKLQKKDAVCVDKDDRVYEYGEFKKIKNFSDCAKACVKDTRSGLLDSLRGYDYDCYEKKCRCLYDRGTLDSRNSSSFNRTSRNGNGKGKVEGTKRKTDFNCAKLSGTDLGYEFGAEREFDAVEMERALRGDI